MAEKPSTKKSKIQIVWFKKDLRITDHMPVYKASKIPIPTLMLYIVETDYWSKPFANRRHWPLFIFSYLAIKFPSKKKLFMHIVVIFGLVIFLGGLDFIRTLAGGAAFENIWADASKIMMLFTGLFFTLQCVRSFIFARRNR